MSKSNVILVLSKEGNSELESMLQDESRNGGQKDNINKLLSSANTYSENLTGSIMYAWKSINWSLKTQEIKFIDEFLKDLDYNQYRFAKIGKELYDIDLSGNFTETFNVTIERSISVNFITSQMDEA